MFNRFALAFGVMAALPGVPAAADSFLPPSISEAYSPSRKAVVTVIPTNLSCAQGEPSCEPAPRAVIEFVHGEHRGNGRAVRLVNRDAPGQALVTDDGQRLLTVNEYAAAGFGENTIVVYGGSGEVIARHALTDFLPEDYVNGLPRTASTIRWWAGEPVIEPNSHRAILSIALVGEASGIAPPAFADGFRLGLDLDTGQIETPSGPEWEKALNCARGHAWVVQDKAAERERARFRALCRAN